MADTNFTRERKPGWATSALPGPPAPSPNERFRTWHFRRSTSLHESGPFGRFLALECLRRLDATSNQIVLITKYIDVGERKDAMLRTAADHIRDLGEILNAYLEPDPSMSVGFALRRLREMRRLPPLQEILAASRSRRR